MSKRREFQCDGRLISYLDVRGATADEAPVLLLVHAFPLAAEMWEPQLAAAPAGWRFVAPDLRGFGRSAPDSPQAGRTEGAGGPAIEDYARDLLALLDHLRVREAVICGLSMGGYIAFALWRLARERVRGLVLADTRPEADSETARAGREQMLNSLDRDGVAAVADGMLPRLLGRTSTASRPAVVDRVRQLARAQSAPGVGAALVRLKTRPDSTALLATIDRPVLVVVGQEDEITGPDIARQMHGQMPAAELVIVGRAGHLANIEQPDQFNAALDRFLARRFLQP